MENSHRTENRNRACSSNSMSTSGWFDGVVLIGSVLFFLGCIATTHQAARTLDPGQASFSGSYLQTENLHESEAEPVRFLEVGTRVGIIQGMDAGLSHAWDFTTDNENAFNTLWGDIKVQFTNRNNLLRKPTVSLGLLKGYVYEAGDDEVFHITSLPLTMDYAVNNAFRPFMFYRYELVREDFIPDNIYENIRHSVGVGAEISLKRQTASGWDPKLGVAVGRFNSLAGGDGDSGLTLNIGLTIKTPLRN